MQTSFPLKQEDATNNELKLHKALLAHSALIDTEDAIRKDKDKRFTGWEPVREIFVTRDEPLLIVKYPPWMTQLPINNDYSINSDEESESTTPTTNQERVLDNKPPQQPQPQQQMQPQEVMKRTTIQFKRPASTTRAMPILPSSPSYPPTTIPSKSTTPPPGLPRAGSSGGDEGRRDFLPKIDPKHQKERLPSPKGYSSKNITFDQSNTPTKLQMYTSGFDSSSPSSSFPNYHQESPNASKKNIDLNDATARLQMYFPRHHMYNSNSKKSVNIT